jgi:drug/metabolite transporter (DMT)-like permease
LLQNFSLYHHGAIQGVGSNLSSTVRGFLTIILAATLWGLSGVVAKYLFASRAVPPLLLVQVRMGLASLLLALALAVWAPASLRVRRSDLPFFVIWGIVGMAGVQFSYLFTIAETNVATAIFLQYLAPILTAAYAWLFEGRRPGPRLLTSLGLALVGSVLLLFGGTGHLLISPLGLTAGLASAVFAAFYTVYGARGVDRYSPWTILCLGLGAGFLFWLVVDLVLYATGRPLAGAPLVLDRSMWPFFLYIAVLATVVPFGLYLTGLRWVTPTQAVLTGMMEPVVGSLAAYLALGEALLPAQVGGGLLIVLAVLLLQQQAARTARDRTAAD